MKPFLSQYGSSVSVVDLYGYRSLPHVDASGIVDSFEKQVEEAKGYNIDGIPDVYADLNYRCVEWDLQYAFDNSKAIPAQTGIRVESSVVDRKVNINVSVGAKTAGEYRIGALLVEDNIVAYQNGGGANYNHTNVLRASVSGDIFGEQFATLSAGDVKSKDYSFDILPKYNTADCSIVVYTLYEKDGKWIIDNSVKAPVGELTPFKYAD